MKEYHLEQCIIRFLKTQSTTDLQRTVDAVATFLYFNLTRFRIDHYNEDSRSDFITYMYPRLSSIISRFDPLRASFGTYLYWITRANWYSFLRDQLRSAAKEKAIQIQEELEFSNNNVVYDFAAQRPVTYGHTKKCTSKKEEIHSRTIFLLACKACCYIDEKTIERVIETTHYTEEYIRTSIEKVRSSCTRKLEVIRITNEKINSYYIRSIRSLYEMKFMKKDTQRYEALMKEYTFCIKRLHIARKTILTHSKSPSNRSLALLLGISRGTIDGTLASAHRGRYDIYL